MNKEKEIQQNELAAWLTKINTAVEPYSKLIAVVVFAVIAAAVAWGLYSSKVSGDRSDATLQLLMKDPEVASKYPGTPAAAWAMLYAGNDDLESGIASLYQNRDDAETMLTQARESYNQALDASEDRLLQSRGHLGLAMVSESLGDIDAAIEAYREVEGIGESDAMVARAKARIEELSSPDIKSFVTWFGEQEFSSADPSLPPELPSGNSLPELPDLTLPTLGSGDSESDDAKSDEDDDEMALEDKSGLELPPTDGDANEAEAEVVSEPAVEMKTPAAEEKPPVADTPPVDETPAAEDAPAAEGSPAAEETVNEAPPESEEKE